MTGTNSLTCLVSILNRLKQSSKEAVENLGTFSDFKKYMHVTRSVELELENLIVEATNSPKSQLILVCGSVGDGKSHVMSYLQDKNPNISNTFYLHNDATESFEPQKTSIETLAEQFADFSDRELENQTLPKKAILAINLGALNNFIDSEQGTHFTKLRQFVERKKILDAVIEESAFDPESNFQFINFSDHHVFQLTPDGPVSDFIQQLLRKITQKTQANPFYKVYSEHCASQCPVAEKCPIKHNFDFLSEKVVQEKVEDVLIQAIIKEKIILSTRSLLNFFHDILVSSRFESLTDEQVKQEVNRLPFKEYVEHLLPVLMFSKSDVSRIHDAVERLSPSRIRSEQLDERIIEFRSRKDGAKVFFDHVKMELWPYFKMQLEENSPWMNEQPKKEEEQLKSKLVGLFIYLYFFVPKAQPECFEDENYRTFMRYLYYWNTNQEKPLSNLYKEEVREAIFNWEEKSKGDLMHLQIGQPQTAYLALQRLDLKPYKLGPNHKTAQSDKPIHKFLTSLKVGFTSGSVESQRESFAEVEIDYSLYQLISRIRKGYRPNKEDKFKFIKFVEFIERLNSFGHKNNEIYFETKQTKEPIRYKLERDYFDDYIFSVVK